MTSVLHVWAYQPTITYTLTYTTFKLCQLASLGFHLPINRVEMWDTTADTLNLYSAFPTSFEVFFTRYWQSGRTAHIVLTRTRKAFDWREYRILLPLIPSRGTCIGSDPRTRSVHITQDRGFNKSVGTTLDLYMTCDHFDWMRTTSPKIATRKPSKPTSSVR